MPQIFAEINRLLAANPGKGRSAVFTSRGRQWCLWQIRDQGGHWHFFCYPWKLADGEGGK
jgi:hypothetical protein